MWVPPRVGPRTQADRVRPLLSSCSACLQVGDRGGSSASCVPPCRMPIDIPSPRGRGSPQGSQTRELVALRGAIYSWCPRLVLVFSAHGAAHLGEHRTSAELPPGPLGWEPEDHRFRVVELVRHGPAPGPLHPCRDSVIHGARGTIPWQPRTHHMPCTPWPYY